jgi:hypothetical protein
MSLHGVGGVGSARAGEAVASTADEAISLNVNSKDKYVQ